MIDDFDRARLILEDLEWWGSDQTQYDERDIGWAIEITLARVDELSYRLAQVEETE